MPVPVEKRWKDPKPIRWGNRSDRRWVTWADFTGTVFICGHGYHIVTGRPKYTENELGEIKKIQHLEAALNKLEPNPVKREQRIQKGRKRIREIRDAALERNPGYFIYQGDGEVVFPLTYNGKSKGTDFKPNTVPTASQSMILAGMLKSKPDRVFKKGQKLPNTEASPEDDLEELENIHQWANLNEQEKPYKIFACNYFVGQDGKHITSLNLKEITEALPKARKIIWTCCQELNLRDAKKPHPSQPEEEGVTAGGAGMNNPPGVEFSLLQGIGDKARFQNFVRERGLLPEIVVTVLEAADISASWKSKAGVTKSDLGKKVKVASQLNQGGKTTDQVQEANNSNRTRNAATGVGGLYGLKYDTKPSQKDNEIERLGVQSGFQSLDRALWLNNKHLADAARNPPLAVKYASQLLAVKKSLIMAMLPAAHDVVLYEMLKKAKLLMSVGIAAKDIEQVLNKRLKARQR